MERLLQNSRGGNNGNPIISDMIQKTPQGYGGYNGNHIIDLGKEKILDMGTGNLYLGKGRGEVFLSNKDAHDLIDSFRLFSNPEILDVLPPYNKDGSYEHEDGVDLGGICELRYDKGRIDFIDASDNVYPDLQEYLKGFNFYRYLEQMGYNTAGLAGGEAGVEVEPKRFGDKHPYLQKAGAIAAAGLISVGVGLGAYLGAYSSDDTEDEIKIEKGEVYTGIISPTNQTPNPISKQMQTSTSYPAPTLTPEPIPEPIPNQPPIADAGGPNLIKHMEVYNNPATNASTPKVVLFDTGPGTYPSIFGKHKGHFTPLKDIELNKIFTYPSPGTGGHSKFIEFLYQNGTSLGDGSWEGYGGDRHNITFDELIKLEGNETYKIFIKTGSYPQIHHSDKVETPQGTIACYGFTDANGRTHKNWIPAMKFFGNEVLPDITLPDTTPPAQVTGLDESKLGQKYIKWGWENPEDPDFKKTMIYLNDQFLTNLSKTIAEYNATGLDPDTQYKLGIKTVDEVGNINPSIVEDYAKTLELLGDKTWEAMNFAERKYLVEEFLKVDPTDYSEIGHCLFIADALYQNATNAKELYGLQDNIPLGLNLHPGHINNAVLLGNNKSDLEHWGFINMDDNMYVIDTNITVPFEATRIDHIWKNGKWTIQNERYRLTNYSVGFDVHWEPDQKPIITVIPEWPFPIDFTEVVPA